ncbi:hypothetical protein SCHPADRAFT_934569 [Schizopora paradoxa]|uniref:Protein YOP1 n=1 Tax=Schizopora paradoxa TaxID=27342 RepID=A0A0H2SUD8_9AGAM|nr:hypothetical protein SCHPADRAFT_934569 [Schizopora paradoxa]
MSAHIVSRVFGAWFAFLLPGFRTFQAVYHKPQNEADFERWSKYWSVMAVVIAAEYTVEWLVSWFPFYWEIKTLVLLFLSLPQIQGSTWVFDSYLAPIISKNEAQLEAHIGSAQSNVVVWAQGRISVILDFVFNALGKARTQAQANGAPDQQSSQQRTAVQGATEAVFGLWRAYGSPLLSKVSDPRSGAGPHAAPPATPRSVSSASSTAVSSGEGVLNARNHGFIPEAQIPLPVTPNEVHNQQNPSGESSTPSFPIPQHFPDTE